MNVLMLLLGDYRYDSRVRLEAEELRKQGHLVVVLCLANGKDYEEKGVKICYTRNNFMVRKIPVGLLQLPFKRRKLYGIAERMHDTYRYDVVHCHDLPVLPVGVRLKKEYGVRLIYDSHEVYPHMLEMDMPMFLVRYFLRMDKKLTDRYVDYVITANENAVNYFREMIDTPVVGMLNCRHPIKEYIPPNNDVFTLCYIGSASHARFFPDMIDIIGNMEGVKLVMGMKKNAGMHDIIKEKSEEYHNIILLTNIPEKEVRKYILQSDVTFALCNPAVRKLRENVFQKQQEAKAVGRPIICTKGTWSGDITEKYKCGVTTEYNKDSVRDAIRNLRDNPSLCTELGMNALRAAYQRYNWEREKYKLLKAYRIK